MPLLFHIAISDQNRKLDAILRMSFDLQSAQRQRTQRGNFFLPYMRLLRVFLLVHFCICVIYQWIMQ